VDVAGWWVSIAVPRHQLSDLGRAWLCRRSVRACRRGRGFNHFCQHRYVALFVCRSWAARKATVGFSRQLLHADG